MATRRNANNAETATLYGLRGAPPSFSAELMLTHKGIPYRRVNLIPGRHRSTLAAKGFPGRTCPALEVDHRRVQTNRAIARVLDELVSEAPLLPPDPGRRSRVEEAEAFCDETFQHAVRRMTLWSLNRDPESVAPHPAIGRLMVPRSRILRRLLMPRPLAYYGIDDEVVRRDFDALPGMLDRFDRYVEEGTLNGPRPTAADFQVAPLVALLLGHREHGPSIARRPVSALAERLVPRTTGVLT